MTDRDQIARDKADAARLRLHAQEHAISPHAAHEAALAHASHRDHERTAIRNVDTHGDYDPNPKINPYATARNGSILGRGDFSTQDQKDDPDAPRGKNIPLARHKPMLAGGDYV